MKTLQSPSQTAGFLAQLLERLDASRVPVDAHQYRTVVDSLKRMLSDDSVVRVWVEAMTNVSKH